MTVWARVPATGMIESYQSGELVKSYPEINFIYSVARHCRYDTTDSQTRAGQTITFPNGRSITFGTKREDVNCWTCEKNIKVPRGQFGKCIRTDCPFYQPINIGTWVDSMVLTGGFQSQYSSGYLVKPSSREIKYLKAKEGGGSWTPEEVLLGETQGSWSYYGGGNVVGRTPWMNIATGEPAARQWDYQNKAKTNDVLEVTACPSNSSYIGKKYLIKKAISNYAHHAEYQVQNLPSDISQPENLNLTIEGGNGVAVIAKQFRLDYIELWDETGTVNEIGIPDDASFKIGSTGFIDPSQTITVTEIVDRIINQKNTSGASGDKTLVHGTDYTINPTTGKITFTETYQETRKNNLPGRCYRIEFTAITQESLAKKSTIENIRTVLKSMDTVRLDYSGIEQIQYTATRDLPWGEYSGGTEWMPSSNALREPYYAGGAESQPLGSNEFAYLNPSTGNYDRTRAYHNAIIYRLPIDFFVALKGYGASIVSATAYLSAKVTKAQRLTYSTQDISPSPKSWHGQMINLTKQIKMTVSTLSSVDLACIVAYEQTGLWGCMNQNGTGSGNCNLAMRRGGQMNACDVHSSCKFRSPCYNPENLHYQGPVSWSFKSMIDPGGIRPSGYFGIHYTRSWGASIPPAQGDWVGYTFDTTSPTVPDPTPDPENYYNLQCHTYNPNSTGEPGENNFYISNKWFGLDVTGDNLISVSVPNDSEYHYVSVDCTSQIQGILDRVNDRVGAGIVFLSKWAAGGSVYFIDNPVDHQTASYYAGYEIGGYGDDIELSTNTPFIILKFQLPDGTQREYPISINLPQK